MRRPKGARVFRGFAGAPVSKRCVMSKDGLVKVMLTLGTSHMTLFAASSLVDRSEMLT